MRAKHFISILLVVLLFNSCKKIREKLFSTRMEGKVVDIQTGKGIPHAKLVVYEAKGDQGYAGRIFRPLKTFYADDEGNFCDKIKILFPDEATEPYVTYILKAEPEGYEKTEGTDYPISGTGILPWGYLRLTRVNKNMVLQCNPEFKLDLTLIDKEPYYDGTFKRLFALTNEFGRSYVQPNGEGSVIKFTEYYYKINLVMPSGSLRMILKGYNELINPPITDTLLLTHFTLKQNEQLTLEY